MGPIYPDTVATTSEEREGPFPPHAQTSGTRVGESLQSLLAACPIVQQLALAVNVSKTTIQVSEFDSLL